MENNINLQKIIEKNYDQIKAGTYEWSDDELVAVYKIAKSYAAKKIFKSPQYKEDFLQVVAINFIYKYVQGYDITQNTTISRYFYTCMENEYNMFYRGASNKTYLNTSSLHELVYNTDYKGNDKEVEKMDLLLDENSTAYEKYILEGWENFLKEEISKTIFLKEVELEKKTQTALAKENNITRAYLVKLLKIEKDIIFLRAINKGVDIPDKYDLDVENMKDNININKQIYKSLKDVDDYGEIEKFYNNVIRKFVEKYNLSDKQMQ